MTTKHMLGALAALGLALPASAATLTFDEAFAPSLFSSARPLSGQYADQGVLFGGHGAVLSSVSDLGVTGFSRPNMVAYGSNTTFRASPRVGATRDTVLFSSVQDSISFDAGANEAFTLAVSGYDAEGGLVAATSVVLDSALQTVTLGGGFTRLEFALDGMGFFDTFAFDNFSFTVGPGFVLVPAPAALALFGLGVFMTARRRLRG